MKIYTSLNESSLETNFKSKITNEKLEKIDKFLVENFNSLFPVFIKLRKYVSMDAIKENFTKEEIELFNNIPIPEEFNLKKYLPVKIFRGLTLSTILYENLKNSSNEIFYNPKDVDYSSWTLSKKTAIFFAENEYSKDNTCTVFESTLTDKNKSINIISYQMIGLQLTNYYEEKNNLSDIQKKYLEKLKETSKVDEKEILVFGKVKCDKFYEV